jgi:hypothetical protein
MNAVESVMSRLPEELTWPQKVAYLAYQVSLVPQACMPVSHQFLDGQYIREMCIPAQTIFLGRVHRQGHLLELVQGEAYLVLPTGYVLKRAPDQLQTGPGFQAVAFTVSDVVVRSFHPDTGERDLLAWEEHLAESKESTLVLGQSIHQRLTHDA